MKRLPLIGGLLGTTALAVVVAASVWTSPAAASVTQTFTTPGYASFFVPGNISSLTIEVWGAQGGAGGGGGSACGHAPTGGFGGYVKATYAVGSDPGDIAPGSTLNLYVGSKGTDGGCGADGGAGGAGGAGGVGGDANGGNGGNGGTDPNTNIGGGGGGGGETDARIGGTTLADRFVSAGGGGGSGGTGGTGGAGGGPSGSQGSPTSGGGLGGTRTTDGGGGSSANGSPGADATDASSGGGGGGGGGLCGGGGGDAGSGGAPGAGGGGGSGYVDNDASYCGGASSLVASGLTAQNNIDPGNSGNGQIRITYTAPPQTRPAADLTATSATLQGFDSNGDSYYFQYGTDPTFATSTSTATTPATEPSPPNSLNQTVTGLTPSTHYYYRVVSTDGGPDPANPPIDFTTLALPVTDAPTGLTATNATLQGTDANTGESYHFEYGETTAYGTSTATGTATGGAVSAAVTGLRTGTTYHYRIVSDAGIGSDQTFSTYHYPVTLPADGVTSSGAVLEGVDSNSGTTYHFEYGTTTAYGQTTAASSASGSSDTVSVAVSGLSAATTYHFRIVDSASGPGRDATFTTTDDSSGGGSGGGGGGSGGGGGGGSGGSGGGSKPAHDLVLGLKAPATGRVGKSLAYVATIGNKGTKAAAGTKLKLVFKGAKIQLVSHRGCSGTTNLTCVVRKLAAGKATRIKVVVRVAKPGKLTVQAHLVTTFKDPTPKNDRTTKHTKIT